MSYDVLKLCKKLEDGTYEVDPSDLFPKTLARILECVKGEPPIEIVSAGWKGRPDREPVADRFLREAEGIKQDYWSLALMPRDHANFLPALNETDSAKAAREAAIAIRDSLLGFIESWFKRALALQVGKGVKLHITRNPDWRR